MTKDLDLELPSVDKLFNLCTNNGKVETVVMLNPSEITDFPNHPFKIEDNEEMANMVESIKAIGVKVPVIVRPKENGGYEMISGHRRNYASKKAGVDKIPAIIRKMTDEEAIIIMVDSNIQREKILPSEKAFAYKMKMEALNHQGKKETSCQVGDKVLSASLVGKENGDSSRQVQRYIRLTELIKEIMDMVDIGKIAFNPAVEISYLTKEEQCALLNCMNNYQSTPSHAQAICLKKLSRSGELTTNKIEEIMEEEKANQKEKYKINYERFEKYLPRNVVTVKEVEDFLFRCVEEHFRREKQKEMCR